MRSKRTRRRRLQAGGRTQLDTDSLVTVTEVVVLACSGCSPVVTVMETADLRDRNNASEFR
jgi:hypothetical protein